MAFINNYCSLDRESSLGERDQQLYQHEMISFNDLHYDTNQNQLLIFSRKS